MTMPSSGPLNMGGTTTPVSVASELGLGLTSTISMNDSSVRTLAGVGGSGTSWSMSSLYGKSSGFSFTISSNQTNANLRSLAVSAGWNQSSPVTATVAAGVYIYSTATGTPGLTIDGSWPGGVTLVNNGQIMGCGGNGGGNTVGYTIVNGAAGGNAISLGVNCAITNNGYIGGGGGGGGQGLAYNAVWWVGGGGGAGGGNGGGNYATGSASAPAGGGPGSAGSSASGAQAWTVTSKGESITMYTGAAGGRLMPGSGGAGGTGANVPAGGTAGGGGGLVIDNIYGDIGNGGAGGSAGNVGSNGGWVSGISTVLAGGGGGGGWGASGGTVGGSISPFTSGAGAGGKAIALNGYTASVSGSGTRYGATS